MWRVILIALGIGAIIYWWAAIWAVIKVILAIVGLIALGISLYNLITGDDSEMDEGLSIILGIGGLLLTIFFLIVPYWSVCRWILLGIGIIGAISLSIWYLNEQAEIREQERLERERLEQERLECERLEQERRERRIMQSDLVSAFDGTFMPVPENLDETHNIPHLRYLLSEHDKLSKIISTAIGEDAERCKKQLFDKQLSLFYELNIYPESKVSKYVDDYFRRSMDLRKDISEQSILQRKPKELEIIQDLKTRLKEISVPNVQYRINKIANMDVSGNWLESTSLEKLTQQTQQYELFQDELLRRVEQLDVIREKVNNELTKVRLVAHRNIYLAREVVNYYLSKAKNNEEMEKSLFNIDISKLERSSLDISELTMDYGDALMRGAFAGLEIASSFRSSGVRIGGKGMIAAAAAGAILDAHAEKEAKKTANREQQRKLVENIEKAADAIQEEKVAIKSTIELIGKIVETNTELYCEYVPLRNKVFSGSSELTKNDFIPLIKVVGAFNEIRNDKLTN